MKRTIRKGKPWQFTVVIEQDEDGYYVAGVPSLPSCHTQARTLEELAARRHRESLKNPAKTIEEYLLTLETQGLTQTVFVLREYMAAG